MKVTGFGYFCRLEREGAAMNILVCDDRKDEAAGLVRLLSAAAVKNRTAVFTNGCDALDYAMGGAPVDACILDIIMPEMDGISLAKKLRDEGFQGAIVFLSTSKEFAPESYEVKAFSYLLKPPTPESVGKLLEQLEASQKNADTAKVLLKTPGIAKSVMLRDIAYVEVIQHKLYFRLRDGSEIAVNGTFKAFADVLLRDGRFVQCHRSFIVNMDEISGISEWEIKMRRGTRIPVSRTYHGTRMKYFKRVFEEEQRGAQLPAPPGGV